MSETTPFRDSRTGIAWKAVIAVVILALAGWILGIFSSPVVESMPEEVRFRPSEETLLRLEEHLRTQGLGTLAGYSLVSREPTRTEEVRVYFDTGTLQLLNEALALYHAFRVPPRPAPITSAWSSYALDRRTLRQHRIEEKDRRPLETEAPAGAVLLGRIRELDYEKEIGERMEARLGWRPDLEPRVLMGITREEWEYRKESSAEWLSLRLVTVRATWWTGGTAAVLDRLTGGLRDIPTSPLVVSWRELEIEEKDVRTDRKSSLTTRLSGFLEGYGLDAQGMERPEYSRAVQLLSE